MGVSVNSDALSSNSILTEATVKWFNLAKGFGFVTPADGSADAFLHNSSLSQLGLREIAEGTKLSVLVNDGPKGRQVVRIEKIMGVEPRPAIVVPADAKDMQGIVKWYKPEKGFGFVTSCQCERDIFVHRSVLSSAGLDSLSTGQPVKLKVVSANKGLEAVTISLAET